MRQKSSDASKRQETLPEPPIAPSRRERLFAELAHLRSALLSAALVLVVLALVIVVARDLSRTPVVLEEFGATEALTKEGYTGIVASNMLWDAMDNIRTDTGDKIKRVRIQTASQQLELVIPASGLSLQRITKVLRSLFNLPQTRITGEFVCKTSACLRAEMSLRIRIFTGEGTTVIPVGDISGQTMEEYFHDAAFMLQQEIDPLVAARYLYWSNAENGLLEAIRISTELMLKRGQNAEEAATFLAEMALIDGDSDVALEYVKKAKAVGDAVQSQQGFWSGNKAEHDLIRSATLLLHARVLAENPNTLHDSENWSQAVTLFEQATEKANDDSVIPWAQAWSTQARGDTKKAVALFERAVEMDKLNPYLRSDLGRALLRENRADEAKKEFIIARNLAPDDIILVHFLATEKTTDEGLMEAKYWVEDEPNNEEAWEYWQGVLSATYYYEDHTHDFCDSRFGPVAELSAVAFQIAPRDVNENIQAFAQSFCG